MIARELKGNQNTDLIAVGFMDDDTSKQKMALYNTPVLGKIRDLKSIIKNHSIEYVIVAIPSLDHALLHNIVTTCNELKVETRMIPKMEDLITGRVSLSQLKEVEVEDLLGRDPVELDLKAISENVTDKTVMITGAGGSIGSELC